MSDNKHLRSKQIPPITIQNYERYLPTAFDESLSLLEKVNRVIGYLHEYSKITDEMLVKWSEVYEWVMNEGLDQTVGDRLKEWLNDGRFNEIINREIFGELNEKIDDTVKKMEEFVNEFDSLKNDLVGRINKEFEKVSESLVNMGDFYDEVEVNMYRDEPSNTTYYLGRIPKTDKHGNPIKLRLGITHIGSYPTSKRRNTREFAGDVGATLAINAGTFSDTTGRAVGQVIQDGKIIEDRKATYDGNYILAFDGQNNMNLYEPNTSPDRILNDGFNNAVTGFIPLLQNGREVSDTYLSYVKNFKEPHPRSVVGKDKQGNIYFFVSEGRLMGEYGMYSKDLMRVLKSHNLDFAYMLDGGGSSQLVHYGSNVNRVSGARSGDNGSTERNVATVLYVAKDNVNKNTSDLMKVIGQSTMNVFKITKHLERTRYQRNRFIEMEKYLINGWKNRSNVGANACRAWVLPNNMVYMVGAIVGGDRDNTEFMQLPDSMRPNFTTHHLVQGNKMDEIYNIRVGSDGKLRWYFWNDAGRPPVSDNNFNYYIRLDGIMFPINPPDYGIQK